MQEICMYLMLVFWLYIIVCFIAPKCFFLKEDRRRLRILIWAVCGTFIITFWAIVDGLGGFITALFTTAIGIYLGLSPRLIKKHKEQKKSDKKKSKEINAIQKMGEKKENKTLSNADSYGILERQKTIKKSRAALMDIIAEAKVLWADQNGYEVGIDYTGADGKSSQRKIKITEVKINETGDIYFDAYCFKSRRAKSFRLDRVDCFYDEDGLVLSEKDVFKALNIK